MILQVPKEEMDRLYEHSGHDIVIVQYAEGVEISVECQTCGETLISYQEEEDEDGN